MDEVNGYKIEKRDGAPHAVRVAWTEDRDEVSIAVKFGLHYIRGNRAPYFSITADGYRNGREDFGGACHELILQKLPALADVVALHLADIDGAPMHAGANGWYKFAGALGGLTEQYHAGSSARHCGGEYRNPTPDECLQSFAEHARMSYALADELRRSFERDLAPSGYSRAAIVAARARFTAWIAAQGPRWKSEADACIQKYGLTVYGDTWRAAA